MDDLEDGELPSSPDQGSKSEDEVAPSYNPLPRPEAAASRPRSATNSSMVAHAGDLQRQQNRQDAAHSSDDQSSPSSGKLFVTAYIVSFLILLYQYKNSTELTV